MPKLTPLEKAQRRERLTALREVLDSVKPKLFDMCTFGTEVENCGTVACLAGHAGMHPWFLRRGFRLDEHYILRYRDATASNALKLFFNLDLEEVKRLFYPVGSIKETSGARGIRNVRTTLESIIEASPL